MVQTRLQRLWRGAREHVGKILVGLTIAVVAPLILSNLKAFESWLAMDIPLGIVIISVAWGTIASVYLIILKGRIRAVRTRQIGILWHPHERLLFKIEVLRKGSKLAESRVVGIFCGQCKSRVEVDTFLSSKGEKSYGIICPNCDDVVGVPATSDPVLRSIVESIVEGRINRGELTVDSNSIEWLDSD